MKATDYCKALDTWATLMIDQERKANPDPDPTDPGRGREFRRAWSSIRLAIRKSCLLSRTIYGGEQPSQTPCPVHQGEWSGCYMSDSDQVKEWQAQGCRCSLHNSCGCMTGWNPDEHCGCGPKECP